MTEDLVRRYMALQPQQQHAIAKSLAVIRPEDTSQPQLPWELRKAWLERIHELGRVDLLETEVRRVELGPNCPCSGAAPPTSR